MASPYDIFLEEPSASASPTPQQADTASPYDIFTQPEKSPSLTPQTDQALNETDTVLGRMVKLAKTPSPAWMQPIEKKIVDWSGKPLGGELPKFTHTPDESYLSGFGKAAWNQTAALSDFLTTPRNLALIAAAPVAPEATILGFSAEMAPSVQPMIDQIHKAVTGQLPPGESAEVGMNVALMALPFLHQMAVKPEGFQPVTGGKPVPETIKEGESDAIKPGDAQMETGEATQRVQTRAAGEVPRTGSSDQVERGTAGKEGEGTQPRPSGQSVAAAPPEVSHEPGRIIKSGADLWRVTDIKDASGRPFIEPIDEGGNVLGPPVHISDVPLETTEGSALTDTPPVRTQAEKVQQPEPPSSPPDQTRPVAHPAEAFGPGAASREEYMRRYALVGASKLLEGHTELGQFGLEMTKEFGTGIADLLPEVFERAKQVVNEFQTATGRSDVAREINRAVGATRATETPVLVRPFSALKAQLLAQEKAGSAGYTRGLKEARTEAKQAMAQFKGDLNQADKFMAGDQEQVRRNLVEFVNAYLPKAERGAFINRITAALRRPSLMRGDPAAMYRHAFDVMQDIEARSEQVYRNNLIDDIKTVAQRASASPSVDLDAKRIMQRMLSDVNLRDMTGRTRAAMEKARDYLNRMRGQGKDVFMPEKVLSSIESLGKRSVKELPTDVLENLHNNISLAERLGRWKFKNRQQVWDAEKNTKIADINSGTGRPLEMNEQIRAQPGETLSPEQKVENYLRRFFNTAGARGTFDLGHLPEDVIFDMLQESHGRYAGPLFDYIRTPVDVGYDAAEARWKDTVDPLREIIDKHKLTDQDEDLIGLWATLQQDGGESRALDSQVTQETIDKLKAKGLTAGQKEAYDYMRKTLDGMLPDIQNVMHELFNVQVTPERNYFPWMREFDIFRPSVESPIVDARTGKAIPVAELHNFGKIAGNFFRRNTSQIPRGFTIDRLPGAETPVRMDSFAVFERHMRNASRLVELQKPLKMAGEIIRSDAFKNKFGNYGQTLLNEWLTATATDGSGVGVYRMPMLDMFRRGANRSLVFFRLSSNIKHASAIPQGIINSGGFDYYWSGLHHQMTAEGKAFLDKFPQIMQRQAGDVSLQELQDTMGRMAPIRWADRWGFVLGKELDAINSRSVFIGRYLKNLQDKGMTPTLKGDIDQAAAYNAMVFMRRTVSSTLAKDIQPVLGRGMGYGGNVSVARMMNAFRQYALERWSLMRYDVPEAFKSGNYTRGLAIMGAIGAAGMYEISVPLALKAGWNALFHVPEGKKHDESMAMRLATDLFSMAPYTSNLVNAYRWGETGVPLADIAVSGAKAVRSAISGKSVTTRRRGMLRAGFAAAELAGLPGLGFAESVVVPKLFPPKQPSGGRIKKLPE